MGLLCIVATISFVLVISSSASITAPDHFRVRFTFDLSAPNTVVFNVTRSWAPKGVDRFYELCTLAGGNYYSNNSMFRVLPGFVVQFGINNNPVISQHWENEEIQDDPVIMHNIPGTLVYATAGPNTRTTQLFVNLGQNGFLDGQGFAPFAMISDPSEMAVLQRLYSGYGEGPSNNQGTIYSQGWSYLKANWPLLNNLVVATLL